MSTKDGMGPEEIEAAESEQDEAEYYADCESDPRCRICGIPQSAHEISETLHAFTDGELPRKEP